MVEVALDLPPAPHREGTPQDQMMWWLLNWVIAVTVPPKMRNETVMAWRSHCTVKVWETATFRLSQQPEEAGAAKHGTCRMR